MQKWACRYEHFFLILWDLRCDCHGCNMIGTTILIWNHHLCYIVKAWLCQGPSICAERDFGPICRSQSVQVDRLVSYPFGFIYLRLNMYSNNDLIWCCCEPVILQVNLDMTDSIGPGKLVRHMQNLSYTYGEYLICIGLGPSISSVICKNPSYSGPPYPSSPVLVW